MKNRDSNADYGSVKIIDEDDNVIHVNTKKKTGRMKGDYKAGEGININFFNPFIHQYYLLYT